MYQDELARETRMQGEQVTRTPHGPAAAPQHRTPARRVDAAAQGCPPSCAVGRVCAASSLPSCPPWGRRATTAHQAACTPPACPAAPWPLCPPLCAPFAPHTHFDHSLGLRRAVHPPPTRTPPAPHHQANIDAQLADLDGQINQARDRIIGIKGQILRNDDTIGKLLAMATGGR